MRPATMWKMWISRKTVHLSRTLQFPSVSHHTWKADASLVEVTSDCRKSTHVCSPDVMNTQFNERVKHECFCVPMSKNSNQCFETPNLQCNQTNLYERSKHLSFSSCTNGTKSLNGSGDSLTDRYYSLIPFLTNKSAVSLTSSHAGRKFQNENLGASENPSVSDSLQNCYFAHAPSSSSSVRASNENDRSMTLQWPFCVRHRHFSLLAPTLALCSRRELPPAPRRKMSTPSKALINLQSSAMTSWHRCPSRIHAWRLSSLKPEIPGKQLLTRGGPSQNQLLSLSRCVSSFLQWRGFASKSDDTVEKQLMKLMEDWELEEAVELLQASVERGRPPHRNVVLNLLQQLANLGEVDILLQLQDFLCQQNLISDYRFYECLHEAYFYSGRVDEGVAVLRLMYHRRRRFDDIDVFFTLLTTMVMRHFPEKLEIIKLFVNDLKDLEEPVLEGQMALWKCYMLAEKFDEADSLLLSNEELPALLPKPVSEICLRKNKVECNRPLILKRLMNLPFLKNRLRVLVMESYVAALCDVGEHWEAVEVLKRIQKQNWLINPARIRDLVIRIETDSADILRTDKFREEIDLLLVWCDCMEMERE